MHFKTLPCDAWRLIAEHLSAVECLHLYWLLYQARVLEFSTVIEAFEAFVQAND